MNPPPEIVLFFGRMHPLLVHLPIGLMVLLALLEWMSRWPRFKQANAGVGVILLVTVPAAVLTALFGWMLSRGGGYDASLLDLHLYTGIATAAICLLGGLFYAVGMKKLYRLSVFTGLLALVVASHYGGSLTHGNGYLTQYLPQPFRGMFGGGSAAKSGVAGAGTVSFNPETTPAFQVAAKPVLDKYCVGCHGPEKSKGELRLDGPEQIAKGGTSGPAVVAGAVVQSLLAKRMHLPSTMDEHMPPDGKPQPTRDEVALLEWWISSGADAGKTVAALKPPQNITDLINKRFGKIEAAPKIALPSLDAIQPLVEKLSADLKIAIRPMSEKDSWLQCNASIAGATFGDEQLGLLAPLQNHIRRLDLGGTKVTDAGLAKVAGMSNLEQLHLEKTAVTDAGLAQLKGLGELEYLNLYGTVVGDAGLEHLKSMPALRRVFLWQTHVTGPAAAAFLEARTDKDQIKTWKDEIEALEAKIRGQQVTVDLGLAVSNTPPADCTVAVNTLCPVSCKPVNPAKTVVHEGKTVAFCCDDCKAQFQKDPKPFLARLAPAADSKVAVNTLCPVSCKPVNPSKTVVHEGKTVAFCCDDCKAQFQKDPKPFLARLAPPAASAKGTPINKTCPFSDKPVNPEKTVECSGKLIGFCCDDCKAKFEKDPTAALAKLGLTGAKP